MDRHSPEDLAERQIELHREISENAAATEIPATFVESAAFCERKAVYRREDDDIPERIVEAQDIHGAVEDAERSPDTESMTTVDAWRAIGDGGFETFRHLPLIRYVPREEVYVTARPTEIAFFDGVPLYAIKRRITHDWVDEVFDNEFTYLWMCGRILDAEGWPVSDYPFRYALVKAHPDTNENIIAGAEQQYSYRQLPRELVPDEAQLDRDADFHSDVEAYTGRYDPETFKADITRWRGVYQGTEEPVGTDHEGRCKSCVYRDECPDALV